MPLHPRHGIHHPVQIPGGGIFRPAQSSGGVSFVHGMEEFAEPGPEQELITVFVFLEQPLHGRKRPEKSRISFNLPVPNQGGKTQALFPREILPQALCGQLNQHIGAVIQQSTESGHVQFTAVDHQQIPRLQLVDVRLYNGRQMTLPQPKEFHIFMPMGRNRHAVGAVLAALGAGGFSSRSGKVNRQVIYLLHLLVPDGFRGMEIMIGCHGNAPFCLIISA